MYGNLSRTGKIFLLGLIFGALFCVLSSLLFSAGNLLVRGALEARMGIFPANELLLSISIFLNNLLVVLLSSIGPTGLVLLTIWGRKRFSFWRRLNDSRIGKSLDRLIWSLVNYFRPDFSKIGRRIHRDIFVIMYGLPSLVMLLNGWVIGFTFTESFLAHHLEGLIEFLKWVVPHGIVEIPVILAAAALGFSFADNILALLYREDTKKLRKRAVGEVKNRKTLKKLTILIILLIIGSIIEVFLTPRIALAL